MIAVTASTDRELYSLTEEASLTPARSSKCKKRCSCCISSKLAGIICRVAGLVGSLGFTVAGFVGIGTSLTCSTVTFVCALEAMGGAAGVAVGLSLTIIAGNELKSSIQRTT